jgi:hypothetical protein
MRRERFYNIVGWHHDILFRFEPLRIRNPFSSSSRFNNFDGTYCAHEILRIFFHVKNFLFNNHKNFSNLIIAYILIILARIYEYSNAHIRDMNLYPSGEFRTSIHVITNVNILWIHWDMRVSSRGVIVNIMNCRWTTLHKIFFRNDYKIIKIFLSSLYFRANLLLVYYPTGYKQ